MKFQTLPRFDNEFRSLPPLHKNMFKDLMASFSTACDSYIANPETFIWPGSLRVRRMTSTKGIWEMTWSFNGPDGRATFEFVDIDGETGVRWRRVGHHEIYRAP